VPDWMGLSGWERADARVRASHQQALNGDVPLVALSTFARWWQFETWLRSLLYLELHAADGLRWESRIGSTTRRRAKADAQNAYMASPDAGSLLAYLDVADLFALIDDDGTWPLVKDALVPRPRWRGVTSVDSSRFCAILRPALGALLARTSKRTIRQRPIH